MPPAIWLAGVIAGLVALPFAHPEPAMWSQVPWLLALSPGQLAVGLLLYMASLKRIPAGRAALLGLLELVLGPVWVWLFDGEKPDDLTLIGGSIVIAAAPANVWLDSRRPPGQDWGHGNRHIAGRCRLRAAGNAVATPRRTDLLARRRPHRTHRVSLRDAKRAD